MQFGAKGRNKHTCLSVQKMQNTFSLYNVQTNFRLEKGLFDVPPHSLNLLNVTCTLVRFVLLVESMWPMPPPDKGFSHYKLAVVFSSLFFPLLSRLCFRLSPFVILPLKVLRTRIHRDRAKCAAPDLTLSSARAISDRINFSVVAPATHNRQRQQQHRPPTLGWIHLLLLLLVRDQNKLEHSCRSFHVVHSSSFFLPLRQKKSEDERGEKKGGLSRPMSIRVSLMKSYTV